VGEPDGPAPDIVGAVLPTCDPNWQRYPEPLGSEGLREALAQWLNQRCGTLLTRRDVLVCHGSKLALALAPLAFTEPGDVVVVPTPGYPTFAQAARQLGRKVRWLRLGAEKVRPDVATLGEVFEGAKLAICFQQSDGCGGIGGVFCQRGRPGSPQSHGAGA
jgi:aspartate/methionine/tyrosine aminotransferase